MALMLIVPLLTPKQSKSVNGADKITGAAVLLMDAFTATVHPLASMTMIV